MSLKDDELIIKIKDEGIPEYFEVLYTRYYPKVLDKCYSFVKNRSTAEELAADIFAKVFEKLPSFKQLSSFSSWLYSISYNYCIDYLRENKKLHYPDWNLKNEIPEIIDETDENIENINYDNLLVILELIHPEEKALLLMKYQDNLSLKQISQALRISEDATKMRLKRARTRVIYLYSEKFLDDQNVLLSAFFSSIWKQYSDMENFLKRVIEGNGVTPSEGLLQSLNQKFANSINVEWFDKGEYFEAIFYKDKLEHIAMFDLKANLLEYKIFLSPGYLPEKLKKIAESKGEIMNAIMRNKGNSVEYEIIIRNENLIRYLIRLSDIGMLIEEKKL